MGIREWAIVASGEWYGSLIDQSASPPVLFHGSYVQAGYFLTNEHRSDHRESGTFGSVTVARPLLPNLSSSPIDSPRGCGAWELTARFGYLDFFDNNVPHGSQGQLVGVHLSQATLGLNWYLADRLRILNNYSLVAPDEPNGGSTLAHLFSTRLAFFS